MTLLRVAALIFVALLALGVSGSAFNGSTDRQYALQVHKRLSSISAHSSLAAPRSDPWSDCWNCESLGNAIVNYYLNAILDGFIVPTCNNACSVITSWERQTECIVVCAFLGATIEVDLFSIVPIDYIYPCQLAGKCMIADCTSKESCAQISSVTASPTHATGDQWVAITGTFNVTQTVGAGLMRFVSHTTKGTQNQLGPNDYYANYYTPGAYSQTHHIDTALIELGDYITFFYVCQGDCGKPYPHTRTLAVGSVSWTCYTPPAKSSASTGVNPPKLIKIHPQ